MKALFIALLFAVPVVAQAPQDPTTATEKMALSVIQAEMRQVQEAKKKFDADLAAFQADYEKAHPGWKFDPEKGPIYKDAVEKAAKHQ